MGAGVVAILASLRYGLDSVARATLDLELRREAYERRRRQGAWEGSHDR